MPSSAPCCSLQSLSLKQLRTYRRVRPQGCTRGSAEKRRHENIYSTKLWDISTAVHQVPQFKKLAGPAMRVCPYSLSGVLCTACPKTAAKKSQTEKGGGMNPSFLGKVLFQWRITVRFWSRRWKNESQVANWLSSSFWTPLKTESQIWQIDHESWTIEPKTSKS